MALSRAGPLNELEAPTSPPPEILSMEMFRGLQYKGKRKDRKKGKAGVKREGGRGRTLERYTGG